VPPRRSEYQRPIHEERSHPMTKLTLRYFRYALTALVAVAFGADLN
jgi:hypothetical protein